MKRILSYFIVCLLLISMLPIFTPKTKAVDTGGPRYFNQNPESETDSSFYTISSTSNTFAKGWVSSETDGQGITKYGVTTFSNTEQTNYQTVSFFIEGQGEAGVKKWTPSAANRMTVALYVTYMVSDWTNIDPQNLPAFKICNGDNLQTLTYANVTTITNTWFTVMIYTTVEKGKSFEALLGFDWTNMPPMSPTIYIDSWRVVTFDSEEVLSQAPSDQYRMDKFGPCTVGFYGGTSGTLSGNAVSVGIYGIMGTGVPGLSLWYEGTKTLVTRIPMNTSKEQDGYGLIQQPGPGESVWGTYSFSTYDGTQASGWRLILVTKDIIYTAGYMLQIGPFMWWWPTYDPWHEAWTYGFIEHVDKNLVVASWISKYSTSNWGLNPDCGTLIFDTGQVPMSEITTPSMGEYRKEIDISRFGVDGSRFYLWGWGPAGGCSGWIPTSSAGNQPPSTPTVPQSSGVNFNGFAVKGQSYGFTSSATDPDGDDVSITFDWGDGTNDTVGPHSSGSTLSMGHSWTQTGMYEVKAKAIDIHGTESDWSLPLEVTVVNDEIDENWGGYMVTLFPIVTLSVEGIFTYPDYTTNPVNYHQATWIGIGGNGATSNLLQAGIALNGWPWPGVPFFQAVINKQPKYSDFGNEHLLDPPSPGDLIETKITEVGYNQWEIYVKDITKGWTPWTRTVNNFQPDTTTAEWIHEPGAKDSGIADFGSVTFQQARLTVNSETYEVGNIDQNQVHSELFLCNMERKTAIVTSVSTMSNYETFTITDTGERPAPTSQTTTSISIHSSARLSLWDPEGNHDGYNSTSGFVDMQIPDSYYFEDQYGAEYITLLQTGVYRIDVVGIGDGDFHLHFQVFSDQSAVLDEWINGTTTIGATETHHLYVPTQGTPVIDDTPPTTQLIIGEPKYAAPTQTYVTKDSLFTLTADDGTGSGVASSAYRIYNSTYDSGWITYARPFYLIELSDGTYQIDYNSTDNTGNVETTQAQKVVLDNSAPLLTVETPYQNDALQDGVTFKVSAWDLSAAASVTFSIQCPQGSVISPEFQSMPAALGLDGKWALHFDTTKLPDGFYLFIANGTDVLGNTGDTTIPFSIHNWATIQLLPSTPDNKVGRTMPIKFSIRVKASVDPKQPFIYNEELTIKIYKKASPSNILQQTSTFGTGSTNYRIDTGTLYITNFKTLSTPASYRVEIYRKGMLLGYFEFSTTK